MRGRSGNLATHSFWVDTYLAHDEVPSRPSSNSPFETSLMAALALRGPAMRGERLVELGCAPGRWMVWYAERFGAAVSGVEYTERGAELTRENLDACGIEGSVHHVDFWDFEPETGYDIVLSLGFIEHFTDVDSAFARHVALVRPGGRIVLGVPNFQGLNRVLQRRFDPDWLALHNAEAMGHRSHLRRAAAHGLRTLSVDYVGSFDPDLISTRRYGRKLLAPFWHLRRRGIGGKRNASWLSAYLLMVFERPADGTGEMPS